MRMTTMYLCTSVPQEHTCRLPAGIDLLGCLRAKDPRVDTSNTQNPRLQKKKSSDLGNWAELFRTTSSSAQRRYKSGTEGSWIIKRTGEDGRVSAEHSTQAYCLRHAVFRMVRAICFCDETKIDYSTSANCHSSTAWMSQRAHSLCVA